MQQQKIIQFCPYPAAPQGGNIDVVMRDNTVQQERLLVLSCCCDVESNGIIDKEMQRKDKFKTLSVFRVTKDGETFVKLIVRYQKSGDPAFEFLLKEVAQFIFERAAQGLFTVIVCKQGSTANKPLQRNVHGFGASAMQGLGHLSQRGEVYKVLFSKAEPQMIEALVKIFKEETAKVAKPVPVQPADLSKKRKFGEMMAMAPTPLPQKVPVMRAQNVIISGAKPPSSAASVILANPRNKVRRIGQEDDNKAIQLVSTQSSTKQQPSLTKASTHNFLEELPSELLGIVLDFCPRQQVYPILRGVSKQFQSLTSKRKVGLIISKGEVPAKMFFFLMDKSRLAIEELTIKSKSLINVPPRELEARNLTAPKLRVLDLLKFANAITDVSLARMVNACLRSLHTFKLGYGGNTESLGMGIQTAVALSKCKQLKRLTLGDPEDLVKPRNLEGRLFNVKKLLNHKQFTLEYLTLYEADGYILDLLSTKEESSTLLQLCIVNYHQVKQVMEDGSQHYLLDDLLPARKLTALQSLNLCSTYSPLQFTVQLPDPSNNQMVSVAGSRELELLFFGLKSTLLVLHLGAYIYDEMLVYIAEMCKALEKIEINSENVTDRGVTPLLVKLDKLKYIDLAACPNFSGIGVMEAGEHFVAKDLRRFVLALEGYEKEKVQQKLAVMAPQCQVQQILRKSYKTE